MARGCVSLASLWLRVYRPRVSGQWPPLGWPPTPRVQEATRALLGLVNEDNNINSTSINSSSNIDSSNNITEPKLRSVIVAGCDGRGCHVSLACLWLRV